MVTRTPNGASSSPIKRRKNAAGMSISAMLESIVGCKWSMAVLDAIIAGVARPGEMRRRCEGISAKVLNERLRKLERFGIVDRQVFAEVPPRVEYVLTPFGRRFIPLVEAVHELEEELAGELSLADPAVDELYRTVVGPRQTG